MPTMVALEYEGTASTATPSTKEGGATSAPGLIVGESGELVVSEQGGDNVSLDDLRQFLVNLPDFPPALKAQLNSIQDWQNTLPLPIPVDRVQSTKVNVSGATGGDGLLLTDNSGLASAIIW